MSLRARVLRGGIYLTLRQALGIIIGAGGVLLLTRAIGPEAYGLYAAALGIFLYLSVFSQWGVQIYLLRRPGELQPQDYHQAFSLLLLLGLAGAGSALLVLPLLESWVQLEGFGPVAAAVFAALPTNFLGVVPFAFLERALDYRRVALVELSGQIIFYLIALPLAYQGLGPWAPVAAFWVQQLSTVGLLYRLSAYRPQLHWEPARIRAMLGYGLGYTSAALTWELRTLVNPLVVSRYAGAEAVGYVALAIRLTEQLTFITGVISRLSLVALARIQEDRARMVKAVTEGISLQLMAIGPILAGFGLVAPWILPLLFGPQWLPVLEVYSFIALSYLSRAGFNLYVHALYVLSRNWAIVAFNLVHVILFAGAALLLVPYLGLKGYGWAEMVALPSYILLLIWFGIYVGRPRYVQTGVWITAWAIPLFSWQLGPWAWTSVIAPLIWPATRKQLLKTVATVLRITYRSYRGLQ